MTLEQRIAALITAIGTDIKALESSGGVDFASFPNLWEVDNFYDELIGRKASDGSMRRLRLDYVPPIIPNNTWTWFFEDFLNTTSLAGGLAATASGGATALTNAEPNAPGILNASTGNTATGRVGIATNAIAFRLGAGRTIYETRVRVPILSNATDAFTLRTGLIDSLTGESTDGVFFRYTHSVNGGNWQGVTRSNNVESVVDMGVVPVPTGWQKLTLNVYPDGARVDYTIDNNPSQALTTNIPTGAGRETGAGFLIIKSAGTTSRQFWTDYIKFTQNFITAR